MLAQTNLELAAATEKLEALRKKLEVSVNYDPEKVPKRWHLPLRIPPSDRDILKF